MGEGSDGLRLLDDEDAKYRERYLSMASTMYGYLEEFWGEKCPEYEPSCLLCQAWEKAEAFLKHVEPVE